MFEPGGTTEIDGRQLAWRSVGAGPPLLLVNGYAATAADWDPAALSALAESFELICPDNRGVGGSQLGDPEELTIDSMAADLEALLDALEIDGAPVAGWSMGGFAVQRLAVRAPHRVEAMALLSTDPGGGEAIRTDSKVWAQLVDRSGTTRISPNPTKARCRCSSSTAARTSSSRRPTPTPSPPTGPAPGSSRSPAAATPSWPRDPSALPI